jgi:hypothetical protein
MNILNKKDQSNKPVGGRIDGKTKMRDVYDWAPIGEQGELRYVAKEDLNIDGLYQRDEVSKQKVIDIARKWDWRLFGALSVSRRPDGSLWVFDGGHRTRAAFKRDDVKRLPCVIHDEPTLKGEAEAFINKNTQVSVVRSADKHRAGVVAEDEIAIKIEAILAKHGYRAAAGGDSNGTFIALSSLRTMVKKDAQKAETVFGFLASCAVDSEQIPGLLVKSIGLCHERLMGQADIFRGTEAERLREVGIVGMAAAIRREEVILGKGGPLVGAKALLDLLNRNRRRKLRFL